MNHYLIFTINPAANLYRVVEGEAERDRIIKHYKETYRVPVYWQEVKEGAKAG